MTPVFKYLNEELHPEIGTSKYRVELILCTIHGKKLIRLLEGLPPIVADGAVYFRAADLCLALGRQMPEEVYETC